MKCHAGYVLIAILAAILCQSCVNDADVARRLDAAESVMDSEAGAALDTLQSIDRKSVV